MKAILYVAFVAVAGVLAASPGPRLAADSGDRGAEGGHVMSEGASGAGDTQAGHGGHVMKPAATTGSWAYASRRNPAPLGDGRWGMVPAGGLGGWASSAGLDATGRCAALLDDPTVMVDRATRTGCESPATSPSGHQGGHPASSDDTPEALASHQRETPRTRHDHDDNMHHGDMDHPSDAWMAPEAEAERRNPVPASPDSIARGAATFAETCAVCHGETARGDGPAATALAVKPADLVFMAGMHPDGDLAWKIAEGRDPMPAWRDVLTEDEIWNLVNYLKGLAVDAGGVAGEAHGHSD